MAGSYKGAYATAGSLKTAEGRKNVARDCAFPFLRDIFSSFCSERSSRPVELSKFAIYGDVAWSESPLNVTHNALKRSHSKRG